MSVRNKYPDAPWNEMAGIRNILIHEYFGVDIKILWSTAKKGFILQMRTSIHVGDKAVI